MGSTPAVEDRTETPLSHSSPVRFPPRALLVAFPFVVAILLMTWMWGGLIRHYHVPAINLADSIVESARTSPPDATFADLAKMHVGESPWQNDADAIRLANELLQGQPITIGTKQVSLAMAMSPEKWDDVPLAAMLSLAVMGPAQIMLHAHQVTGDTRYLAKARDMILAFDSWDRHAWMPVGLAWNDHAVAARAQILADFWGAYRRSVLYNPQDARRVLELVERHAARLADDRNFNVETNHGVMQNIALLETAIAFPGLPGAEQFRDIGVRRLNTQMGFYVSDEGVILEHSAFYHYFGLRLLTVASRMMQMLNVPLPEPWERKYRLAQDFYRELQRPDGSLPQFGDTYAEPEPRPGDNSATAERAPAAANSMALYPVSGYAISWTGSDTAKSQASQTVLTWSNFPSGSHKHADDLSLLVWAGGESWWTNVGYWPYGDPARHAAENWTGSNAPHLADEPEPKQSGRLLATAASSSIRFLDVERTAHDSVLVRRQVIELPSSRWIVLDSTTPSSHQVFTSWNTSADVSVREEGNNCYRLVSTAVPKTLETCLSAGTQLQTEWLRGSTKPFAGWQVVHMSPAPANALLVGQPTGSWTANTFELLKAGEPPSATPATVHWQGPERWTVNLADGSEVSRDGNTLRFEGSRKTSDTATLTPPPAGVSATIETIRAKYFTALRQYPKFDESYAVRRKLTIVLLVCLAACVAAFVVIRRVWSQIYWYTVAFAAILWVAGALTVVSRFKSIF